MMRRALMVACLTLGAPCALADGAANLAAAHQPSGVFMDRVLAETVTAGDKHFVVCASIRNVGGRPIRLTTDLGNQIVTLFRSEKGAIDAPDRHGFVAEHFFAPPLPWLESSFLPLEADGHLEHCQTFSYDEDFHNDVLKIQTTFHSWLSRKADVPTDIRTAWAARGGENGRPLYSDEPLYSNVCTLTRSTRTARCDPVPAPSHS